MKQRLSPTFLVCVVYFVLHYALHLNAGAFEVSRGISIWYPPCGLALSLLILLGVRYWPVVLFTNIITAYINGSFSIWWAPIVFPILITLNYGFTAWVVRRRVGPIFLPGNRWETLFFSAVILISPAMLAIAGTSLLWFLNLQGNNGFWHSIVQWWIGDVSGLVTVVPCAMVFLPNWLFKTDNPVWGPWNLQAFLLTLCQFSVLVLCLIAVFAFRPLREYNAFHLCFLPLIWICLRHGLPGATLATLVTTMAGLLGMHYLVSTDDLVTNFLLFELAAVAVGLGLGSAVTRRNEVERKLAESQSRFQRVISGAQLALWDWDVSKHHISYNPRWAEIIGVPFDQIDARYDSWESLIHPADKERVSNRLAAHIFGNSSLYEIEYRLRCHGQHWRWILFRGSVVSRDDLGHPLLVSGTNIDVTDRKHAEAETRRLLQIIEATTDFVATTDVTGGLLYANAAFLALLSKEKKEHLPGQAITDLMPNWAARLYRNEITPKVLKTGFWSGEIALRRESAEELSVSIVALAHRDEENEMVSISLIMRDISHQKKAELERIEQERKLLQVQKLESLGVLAGGIAHDFNNLLTVVLGNASLARFDLPANSNIHTPLAQIESAALSAAELCQQMLAYAGRSPLAFTDVDIADLIEDTTHLLQVSMGKKHILDIRLSRPIARIHADPTQIRQVIMNLALNASEAIGDNEGTITLRGSVREYNEEEIKESFHGQTLIPGRYLLLEVEDTGCGMSDEVLSRIFEPFFSTKFTGHGLGLAAVLGIVRSHGGGIRVNSKLGVGTCFQLVFPALDIRSPKQVPQSKKPQQWRGSGLVLVVDDEASVRSIIGRSLESFGYTPILARDGMEGIELFKEHAKHLKFVLLDLTMPKMDGEETFQEFQKINPTLPIILMSGFSEASSLDRFVSAKPAAFIAKPFDHRALYACIEQLSR